MVPYQCFFNDSIVNYSKYIQNRKKTAQLKIITINFQVELYLLHILYDF